jgi:hypothetical protein
MNPDWTECLPRQAGVQASGLTRVLELVQSRGVAAQLCVLRDGNVVLGRTVNCDPGSLFWTSPPANLRYAGKHYRLGGAQRGPLPAHYIPIWLGARKPRMLRLIGAKADGWLPSISYLEQREFQTGNKIIDEAAAEAGRDLSEIRRLVNISGSFSTRSDGFLQRPSEQWVDELLPLGRSRRR